MFVSYHLLTFGHLFMQKLRVDSDLFSGCSPGYMTFLFSCHWCVQPTVLSLCLFAYEVLDFATVCHQACIIFDFFDMQKVALLAPPAADINHSQVYEKDQRLLQPPLPAPNQNLAFTKKRFEKLYLKYQLRQQTFLFL